MKPSKWVRVRDAMWRRGFGALEMLAWEGDPSLGGLSGWSIDTFSGQVSGTGKDIDRARHSAARMARKMVRKMAAELGMVKL